jgi:hypothetical protein
MSLERIAKWSLFIYHKLNEHTRAYEQCLYSLLARINPSNSMIMQAVSLLSLNVLMLFFLLFSLPRLRDELPILLTIVRTRQERISQLNKNKKRKRDEKKNLLIGDGSLYVYFN